MNVQYISDNLGNKTAVVVAIEDWESIKKSYPSIEKVNEDLPQWQKDILDTRLADLDNPDKFKSIEYLFDVLDEEI
ncbi:addiction module component CHP02574 family protein [Flavobacterium sp. TAB 87]|uniref:addiction module component CHP02574 family protein n=1 Tax=Flavobacterium sp. TAB 87 TaxID=1729581 RepID=UPI00076C0DFA|nr:addiction module component CHP02574 family protein [Flavobacterium sp. TAB 87]KVV14109.1 hypothetical protein AP058_01995 [Flavobacterium sp. TAB 87]